MIAALACAGRLRRQRVQEEPGPRALVGEAPQLPPRLWSSLVASGPRAVPASYPTALATRHLQPKAQPGVVAHPHHRAVPQPGPQPRMLAQSLPAGAGVASGSAGQSGGSRGWSKLRSAGVKAAALSGLQRKRERNKRTRMRGTRRLLKLVARRTGHLTFRLAPQHRTLFDTSEYRIPHARRLSLKHSLDLLNTLHCTRIISL